MENFSVKVSLSKSKLTADVENFSNIEIQKFSLLKYGKAISSKTHSQNSCEFELEEDGLYAVSVAAICDGTVQTRYSYPVFYSKEETRKEFEEFCKEPVTIDNSKLDLCELKYPYCYVGYVYAKEQKDIEQILKTVDEKLFVEKHNSSGYIVSSEKAKGKNLKVLISGMANHNGKFVFGNNDLTEDIAENMLDDIGNYSMLVCSSKKVTCFNDFFGQSKLYYYEDDNYFITCNQYHLLLLILKELGIKPELNHDIVKAIFTSNHYLFAQQVFTRESIFNGIKMLSVNERVEITDKPRIVKTKLEELLVLQPKKLSKTEYFKLLEDAKTEILSNLNCVLNSKSVEKVTVDVTGGLDSRMVLSALSNVEGFNKKVKVRSLDIGEDLKIACNLVNSLDMEFDDAPSYNKKFNDSLNYKRSLFMGGYYKIYPIKNELVYDKSSRVYLSGGYGEQMTRYYLTKNVYNGYLAKIQNTDSFCVEFLKQLSRETVSYICDYDTSIKYAEKEFIKEVENLSGCDNVEKLEHHYLALRGGLHFKQYMNIGNIWLPIMSKNLFKIFKYKARKNVCIDAISFELICYCNQVLGVFEYGNENYNKEFEKFKNELNLQYEYIKNLKLCPNYDMTKREISNTSKVEKGKTVEKLSINEMDLYNNIDENIYKDVFYKIREFNLVVGDTYKDMLYQIWNYCRNENSKHMNIKWIWSRLVTIMDQIKIFQ